MGTSGGPCGNVAASWLISGGRSGWLVEDPAKVDIESWGLSSCNTAISTRELDLPVATGTLDQAITGNHPVGVDGAVYLLRDNQVQ